MIVHKKLEDKKCHEGLEYFYRSKEPEHYTDCVNLPCWECIFNRFNVIFYCKKRDEFKKRSVSTTQL